MACHVHQACGNRRVRDHGVGHRRDARRCTGSRWCCAPGPRARPTAWSPAWRSRSAGRSRRASSPRPTATRRSPACTAVSDLGALAECDLVIESVVEDLGVKKHLFSELDRICPDHVVLATNTSTLPVVDLAMETGRPDKVCGIHFFNPAPVMSLVEVVRPITASDDTIAARPVLRRGVRQDAGGGEGPGRLHRERPALPVPEQRRAPARAGRGLHRRHRRGDEGRVRVPDGARSPSSTWSASTPAWPSSTPCTTSSATPTTPRCRCCGAWWRPSSRPQVGTGLLRLPEVTPGPGCPGDRGTMGQGHDGK